jgi:hypothetical protein
MTGADHTTKRVPVWPEVRRLLDLRDPQVVLIEGAVSLELRIDGDRGSLALRCPIRNPVDPATIGAPEELRLIQIPAEGGGEWLEVAVSDAELFPYFVSFAETVVDAIHLHGTEVVTAIRTSMRLFRRLLRDVRLIPQERLVGLLGELWVLNRLLDARGREALESWTGPRGEAHDFRIGEAEFEVKTTTRQHRVHRIHGLDQLEPSVGAQLYLVSIQLAAGGSATAAFTLADQLAITRERLSPYGQSDAFGRIIASRYGLLREDEQRYGDRFRLRSPTRLIVVDESLPRLSATDLAESGKPEMQRVVEVEYLLDVDGLGVAEGTSDFERILPGANDG